MKKKSTDFPKIMVDKSSPSGFTGMTPEDDVKIKEFNRLDRSTYPSDPKQREKLFKEAMSPTMFPKYVGRSAKAKWNAIYKEMTPKERREFFKDKREKPKGLYDDIPKPTPLPQFDLEIFRKKIKQENDDKEFKKIMSYKEDPDLWSGLGSLFKPKTKG